MPPIIIACGCAFPHGVSRLTQDPRALAEALRNPKRALDEARLDEAERQALQSRTAQALWDVLLKREPQPIAPAAPLAVEIQEGLEGRRGSLVVVGTGIRTVEAALFPGVSPAITRIALGHLTADYVNPGTTMYVPPGRAPSVNQTIAAAMGVPRGGSMCIAK